ncbi:MAG: hypothetical protein M3044_12770, partial [Thermoproteota archaeon]|nr:hypothetical protein [Thermoproteota archaeon]
MINTLKETLVRHKRIISVLIAVAAIAAYMIPANSLAFAAISQSISQTNANVASNSGKYGGAFADNNFQVNVAHNSAFMKISSVGGPTNGAPGATRGVAQSIDQSNLNLATNTGDFGTASASHNTQINIASNHAKVVKASNNGGVSRYVGNSGGGVVST